MDVLQKNIGPLSPMLQSFQSDLFPPPSVSGPSNWSRTRKLSPDDQKKIDSDQEKGEAGITKKNLYSVNLGIPVSPRHQVPGQKKQSSPSLSAAEKGLAHGLAG